MLIVGGIIIVGAIYFLMMERPASDDATLDNTMPTDGSGAMEDEVSEGDMMTEAAVLLSEQNESGETGMVTMTEENGQITVSISMSGAPETAQPAHIHTGSCPTPGGIVYPLTDVVNGMSETVIDATMEDLRGQLPLAVNIHQSAAEIQEYVACGDVNL